MTPSLIDKLVAQFKEKISKTRSIEGEFAFKTEIQSQKLGKAVIEFTDIAYLKMMYLIDKFEGEVGWYGLVNRKDDNVFEVYDIVVYPQSVTGATVTTDEIEMGKWEESLSDEAFNAKRFQGHSHVNFAPHPSATDLEDRKQKVQMLMDDDYFIFMIINKKREYTASIYDMKNNIQYETDDIEVTVNKETLSFLESTEKVDARPAIQYGTYYQNINNAKKGKTKKNDNVYARDYDGYDTWNKGYASYLDD